MTPNLSIFPDPEGLAQAAADLFVRRANEIIHVTGAFTVALSGGSTPQAMFRILAHPANRSQVDWSKIHLFWGDERCVSPDHPDSNYFHARQLLLSQVAIPETNVHRIHAELPVDQAADQYEKTLKEFFSPQATTQQAFDLLFLGMGEDGHTASLFPGTPAVHEAQHWVVPVFVSKFNSWRISLTPVILNRSSQVIFLVSGQGKSETLKNVLYGNFQPDLTPAQVIQAGAKEVIWFVDKSAASRI
jgi:6-phosphogluconolactonase